MHLTKLIFLVNEQKTIVIIPTYNEIQNISRIIDLVISEDKNIDVLVVDDNSPDGIIVSQKGLTFKNEFFD